MTLDEADDWMAQHNARWRVIGPTSDVPHRVYEVQVIRWDWRGSSSVYVGHGGTLPAAVEDLIAQLVLEELQK